MFMDLRNIGTAESYIVRYRSVRGNDVTLKPRSTKMLLIFEATNRHHYVIVALVGSLLSTCSFSATLQKGIDF